MKLKSISFVMMAAMLASCANEELVEANPDVQGNALAFRATVGHARATETTVTNLGDFHVVAKGIHPHGGVYTSYLIGGAGGGAIASREGASNIWKLDASVYWPTSINSVLFWAYTGSQTNAADNTKTDVMPAGTSFSFDSNGTTPTMSDFVPAKADMNAPATHDQWNDGQSQIDFLVSFKQQERSTSPSNVDLTFDHALSQITVKAKSAGKLDSDNRIVKIKGAWIVNSINKGNLSAGFTWNAEQQKATATPTWTGAIDGFSAYGSFFKKPVILDKTTPDEAKTLIGESLMLIPQELKAWNKDTNNTGAYILLLCRIELEHDGTSHPGSTNVDDIGIIETAKKHYHQQFPVNTTNTFNANEYGWVCVPVNTTWEMGKKYEYTLDICGAETGAGIYPPDVTADNANTIIPADKQFTTLFDENPVDLSIINRSAGSGKEVGAVVLDAPIQFSVKVNPWNPEEGWTPGNVPLTK